MAISWGSWDYGNSSAGFRVGVETTVSSVTNASTSVTITTKWYVEAMYNVDDEMTVTFGGSISGSSTQNLTTGSSGGYKLWATKTYTYTYSTYGTSPGTRTFSGSLSGVYNGANPTKSTTVTIPARPYGTPTAPSSVTAVRNSDSQGTVSWVRNATTGKPYTSLTVQRRVFTGSTWSAYATVATTSSTATSYVDTTLVPNRFYQYQVKANNSVGSSAYVASGNFPTTPAAPSSVASTLNPAGTQITTTWVDNAYVSTPAVTFTVQRSVNGGAYANVATGIAQGVNTWTDPTPGAGTNRYQVAAVMPTGPLTSAFVEGNTISTIVPPLAPTNLSPNTGAQDATGTIVLTWTHNHGGDSAAQSAFIIEYSTNGGSSWSPLNGAGTTSTVSSYTVPANTWTNGQTIQWRVKTQGVASAGYGPMSAAAVFVTSAKPVTTLTAPPATVNAAQATATWTYSQAQSSAQAAWEANLYEGGVLLEARTANNNALTTTFDYPLVDQHNYTVAVRTKSAAGVWSTSVTRAFQMVLLPPAATTIDGTFQPCTGTVVLHLEAPEPVGGVSVAAVSAKIERRINGGDWVLVADAIPLPNDLLDLLPSTNGINEYRATTASATPSYLVGDPVIVVGDDTTASSGLWTFLSWGTSFEHVLRMHGDVKTSQGVQRESVVEPFLGQPYGGAAFGESIESSVTKSGTLYFDATCAIDDVSGCTFDSPPADWYEAAEQAEIVCLRDYTGRRMFGTLSGLSITDEVWPSWASLGFTVTRANYVESGGVIDVENLPPESQVDWVVDGGNALSSGTGGYDGGGA